MIESSARPFRWHAGRHSDDGAGAAASVIWRRFEVPQLACSTALLGGGLLTLEWVLNATVSGQYFHADPIEHASAIAADVGLVGPGACLLTAVDVATGARWAAEDGVSAMATAGISSACWAASDDASATNAPGTINIVVEVPVPLTPAALVNMVVTVTEAKTQYFTDRGLPATGTPTDAVVVLSPRGEPSDDGTYGGPRSRWGAVVARTVLAALHARDAAMPA